MNNGLYKQLQDLRHNVAVLERKLYGQETEPFTIESLGNQNIVHIAQDFEGNIDGVFLCDKRASALADSNKGFTSSWLVEIIPPVGELVPVEYFVGQKVSAQISNAYGHLSSVEGTIIYSDEDPSQGVDKIIYKLDIGEGAEVMVAGEQIERLL